ncbi:helicase HerA-like domain-containing protein [Saccharopolyspora shandongensis]|uniref:helicase HerA-like domain-containing protein n=1 Tax=Saccharopolyspora shandongensis TaxID=418495 RepID=UPI00340B7E48
MHGKYEQAVDRESAHELLAKKIAAAPETTEKPEIAEKFEKSGFLEKATDNPGLRSAASALGAGDHPRPVRRPPPVTRLASVT